MFMDSPDVIIPVFGIFMIIAVVIGPIWIRSYYRSREREQLHATLRAAYEKGLPPPPELIEKLTQAGGVDLETSVRTSTSEGDLRRAVVLIAAGIGMGILGVALGYGITFSSKTGGWVTAGAIAGSGAIPGMIGVAYLFLWLGRRQEPRP